MLKYLRAFWAKVDKNGPIHPIYGRCWVWTAAKTKGYGKFGFRDRTVSTHRFSWVLHRGNIPDNLCVLHKCDNRSCINPKHLFLGTKSDNNEDMTSKGRRRWAFGENAGRAKLTNEQVLEIRQIYKWHSRQYGSRQLAKLYGVSPATIYNITAKKLWKHIP